MFFWLAKIKLLIMLIFPFYSYIANWLFYEQSVIFNMLDENVFFDHIFTPFQTTTLLSADPLNKND